MKLGEILNAYSGINQLNSALSKVNKVAEQVASGTRLTKASVDPSALVISERMKAQITDLTRQAENISMAINRDQTADGAYAAVTESLQEISELTVQAGNGILTSEDKAIIQREINQLTAGISEVVASTEFNAQTVLPADLVTDLGIGNINVENPGLSSRIVSDAIEKVSSMRSELGGKMNANIAKSEVLMKTAMNTVEARSRIGDTDFAQAVGQMNSAVMQAKSSIFVLQAKSDVANTTFSGILGIDKYA